MRVTVDCSSCLFPWGGSGSWLLTAAEYLHDSHRPTTAWAWLAQCKRDHLSALLWLLIGFLHLKQGSDLGDVGLSGRIGQQTIVPDAVEAVGQDVDQESANKLAGSQAHGLLAVACFDPIILPAESHGLGVRADQSSVRDGDAVGLSTEIGQHGFGTAEGRFGIDHTLRFTERDEPPSEGIGT